MHWYVITSIVAFLICFSLTLFVYWRSNGEKNIVLFANMLSMATVWLFGSLMVNISKTAESALLWSRILHIGAVLVVPAFFHFAWDFTKTSKSRTWFLVPLTYATSAFILLWLFDPSFITDVAKAEYIGWAYQPGPLYNLYIAEFSLASLYGIISVFVTFKKSQGYKRQKAKYFLLCLSLASIAGISYFLISIIDSIKIPPVDNIITIVFSTTFTYAMLTYRLVDIRIAISKIIVFLAYFVGLTLGYSGISILFIWLFAREIFSKGFSAPLLIAVLPFTIFVAAFPPLRHGIMQHVDTIVYGRGYNYRKIINETTGALVSILDLRELLGYLTDTISKNLRPQRLYLFVKEGEMFNVRACSGVMSTSLKLPADNPLVNYLEGEQQALLAWEFESKNPHKKKIISTLNKLHAEAIVPLFVNNRLTGFLALDAKQSGKSYSPQDFEVLNAIATSAAIALQNAHLYQEAITDGLTGLYHHKYFQSRIKEELDRAITFRFPLAVIMLDIDYFKKINDTHGHQIGDQVLKELSKIIMNNLRLFDIIARYGGEEFAILLPSMGEESAAKHFKKATTIAQRLRQEVQKNKFTENQLDVTISLGVALFDGKDDAMTPRTLINEADEQLYRAKESGRNKVRKTDLSKHDFLGHVG